MFEKDARCKKGQRPSGAYACGAPWDACGAPWDARLGKVRRTSNENKTLDKPSLNGCFTLTNFKIAIQKQNKYKKEKKPYVLMFSN